MREAHELRRTAPLHSSAADQMILSRVLSRPFVWCGFVLCSKRNMRATRTDSGATEWRIKDEVVRFRAWATDVTYALPPPPTDSVVMGTAETCLFRLTDPLGYISRRHAMLKRHKKGWLVRDLDSKNGLKFDGTRGCELLLEPGLELGIGQLTLLTESPRFIELREFVRRLVGWSSSKAGVVDLALRAIRLAVTRRNPLVLCGAGDLTQVAYSIHRHALGPERPFVVSDPRRRETHENARNAENVETGMAALQRAVGGSVCVWSKRLPPDFERVRAVLRDPTARAQLIVCVETLRQTKPYHVEPIVIPALKSRTHELPRIVAEYADEAAADLGSLIGLGPADQEWISKYSASSLWEIEKGARRLTAIRQHDDNLAAAARALGMAQVSLHRWIGRRALPGHESPRRRTSRTGK